KPEVGDNLIRYKAQLAGWQNRVAQAQNEVAYWERVRDYQTPVEEATAVDVVVEASDNKNGPTEAEPKDRSIERGRTHSQTATSSEDLNQTGTVRLSHNAVAQNDLLAKLRHNYYTAKKKLETFAKDGYRLKSKAKDVANLVRRLASSMGLKQESQNSNSFYNDFAIETVNGKFRLSDHPANGELMSRGNFGQRISVYIYGSKGQHKTDGTMPWKEFVFYPDTMSGEGIAEIEKAEGKTINTASQDEITKSIALMLEDMLEGRKAQDRSGKAEVKDYNQQPVTTNDVPIQFSIRRENPPKKTGLGYKVFVLKNGKLYPPMVANPNGEETPVGVWLNADAAPVAGQSKTGRNQVKAGGKGTQSGSGKLSYRPGWHLGEIPYALQFNRINPETGEKELFPNNFVWAEVEYADDVDCQQEAMANGFNANGKFQHSLAGLPRIPENGSYRYRTNPNPETDPWIITGAMKVNRVLTLTEVDGIVRAAGREPQQRQKGAITDEAVKNLNKKLNLDLRPVGNPT
ncbi:MAG: hypothetical protein HUJ93_08650, partial [Bacteroidales bacterium]|nr:hypothetical protein [Bacteroidales bacterium]